MKLERALLSTALCMFAVGCSEKSSPIDDQLPRTPGQRAAPSSTTPSSPQGAAGGNEWRAHWCRAQETIANLLSSEIPKSADGSFYLNGKSVDDPERWCAALRHAGGWAKGFAIGVHSTGNWLLPNPDDANVPALLDLADAIDAAGADCEPKHAGETVLKMNHLLSEYAAQLARTCQQ